jgi:hypothetical protein
MRKLLIALLCLAGLGVGFLGLVFGLSEAGGEIVTLETRDSEGQTHATRLWVVDHEGAAWLRSGMPTSAWYVRLVSNPNVQVTRDGSTQRYRAEPIHDPAVRDRIHALVAEKYGFSESFVAATRDGTLSVPIRLIAIDAR